MVDAASSSETLADLGEWELIRRLGAFAPAGQFRDDAAVLEAEGPEHGGAGSLIGSAGPLVLNSDLLVEGVHFSDATTAPEDVGWRTAAANLSDLAAMGCTQVVGITVGLVAPASTPWSWVEGVYRGLGGALATYGGVVLGGDCSGGAERVLAVSALGRLPAPPADCPARGGPWGAIRRGDGRPGDALVSTGPHGLSRLGLALLQGELPGLEQIGPQAPSSLPIALVHQAIEAHQRPKPRFDAVWGLHHSRPHELPWRVGGCDSSDGLAAAVRAIATTSGCAVRLDREALPLVPAMAALPQAEAWCLGGGEDFELVLALEARWAKALTAALPGSVVIGELLAGPADEGIQAGGYRHFA